MRLKGSTRGIVGGGQLPATLPVSGNLLRGQTLVSVIDQFGAIACSKLAVGISPESDVLFAVQNSSTKSSAQKLPDVEPHAQCLAHLGILEASLFSSSQERRLLNFASLALTRGKGRIN